jgi:pimeloyl-ACP methyl ester carboxylesterase
VRNWIYSLDDGQLFACRGRDFTTDSMMVVLQSDHLEERESACQMQLTQWEYGVGLKMNRSVFLLWQEKVEKHDIGSLDLVSLLHVCGRADTSPPLYGGVGALHSAPCKKAVIILCHGFSPDVGPRYPLIIILNKFFAHLGYAVVQPNFTDTYAYGPARGRSERACVVLEALLHVRSRFPDSPVVLIGHSQGGAAAAQACRRSVVADGNIRGLVMIGSESPRERINLPQFLCSDNEDLLSNRATSIDIYGQPPPGLTPAQILMLHSTRDPVICDLAIEQLVGEASEYLSNFRIFVKLYGALKRSCLSGARLGLRAKRGAVERSRRG